MHLAMRNIQSHRKEAIGSACAVRYISFNVEAAAHTSDNVYEVAAEYLSDPLFIIPYMVYACRTYWLHATPHHTCSCGQWLVDYCAWEQELGCLRTKYDTIYVLIY